MRNSTEVTPPVLKKIRNTTQEHPLGCAVACVASLCGISYQEALSLFTQRSHAWTRGYYCNEIIIALNRAGLKYTFEEFDASHHEQVMRESGTIVFVKASKKYPMGHYLIRSTQHGWMNPWLNFPVIAPAKSGFQSRLPGRPSHIVYPVTPLRKGPCNKTDLFEWIDL